MLFQKSFTFLRFICKFMSIVYKISIHLTFSVCFLPQSLALSGPFRVQGRFEGEECWIDGDGDKVDTTIEADPEDGIVQTLIFDGENGEITTAPEDAPMSILCKKPKPAQGNKYFNAVLNFHG